MKSLFILCTSVAILACAQNTKLHRAFEQRNSIDFKDAYAAQLVGGQKNLDTIQYVNFKNTAREFPAIENLVRVEMQDTIDKPTEKVITLYDVDGVKCSLWVMPSGKIRAISPY